MHGMDGTGDVAERRTATSNSPTPRLVAPRRQLLNLAESVLIAVAGGYLFDRAGFPAGWLAGALSFTAVAALAGRPIFIPTLLARALFVTLGMSIGAMVTPETLRGIGTWPASVVMVSIAMACVTVSTVTYLRCVHGWDLLTAIFAGIPGGLSQVVALAVEEHSDLRAFVIVQTVRVVILGVGIPAGLALFGLAGPTTLPASGVAIADAPGEFFVLVAASVLAAVGLLRLGFPGGLIFGPMLVSAVLHGGAFIHVNLPTWLAVTAMVGLGAVNGSRFTSTPLRMVTEFLGAALGSFAVALVVTAVFVLGVTALLSLPIPGVIIAYAPGSVDAMMILALALHIDPVFVGAHHLARVFTVSLALPIMVRYCTRADARK